MYLFNALGLDVGTRLKEQLVLRLTKFALTESNTTKAGAKTVRENITQRQMQFNGSY